MRLCVLAGGVGSARFLAGLVRVVEPSDVTVIGNTGDDERIRGLHVCPDIDTVLYHLAGHTDWERGWGLDDETFTANDRYRELVSRAGAVDVDMQEWFALGDRDLATHMLRTRLLDAGRSLFEATEVVRRGLGVASRVLPMSDEPVRTMLTTTAGDRLDFQTYFVRHSHEADIASIDYVGIDAARPGPEVIEAIASADVVVIPPSNPLLSIGPVLAVDGVREALASRSSGRVAVSPIVGGRALKGPADTILASFGHEVSAAGVAERYRGLVDLFVIDDSDKDLASRIDSAFVCDTIMSGPDQAARLAKEILTHV